MREPEPVIVAPNGRPALTLSEAARAAGVSRSTIRRRHEAGAFRGAFQDDEGAWRVLHDDLLAAGLVTRTTPPDGAPIPAQPRPEVPPTAPLVTPTTAAQGGAHALTDELHREREARQAAEAREAEERERRKVAEARAAQLDRHVE